MTRTQIAGKIAGQILDVCQRIKETLDEYEATSDYDDIESLNLQLATLHGKYEVLSNIRDMLYDWGGGS